jgi:hypothetical protein
VIDFGPNRLCKRLPPCARLWRCWPLRIGGWPRRFQVRIPSQPRFSARPTYDARITPAWRDAVGDFWWDATRVAFGQVTSGIFPVDRIKLCPSLID